jgi:hypothetical protein
MSAKDDLMNGAATAPAIEPAKQAFMADPGLVALAERVLADAKSGAITSMAVVLCNRTGNTQWPAHGVQATELYLGAGLFQRSIENIVTGRAQSNASRLQRLSPADQAAVAAALKNGPAGNG